MFDVFDEEIEVLIKDGISNLYWFKGDLHKAWLRSGVAQETLSKVKRLRDHDGKELTKRAQMDALYLQLRSGDYDRRLEVSRNFVRILVTQESFTQQDNRHQIHRAQLASLRLKELLEKQKRERDARDSARRTTQRQDTTTYEQHLSRLQGRFFTAHALPPQKRGYELESIFTDLMQVSGVQVEKPFRTVGEQFDGAIKHEGHYYLIELKWTSEKTDPGEAFKFYAKVQGKMGARGIFISMSGFTNGVIETLPNGRDLNMMLLDGVHISNVLAGAYTFKQLLDHAIKSISLKGKMYSCHNLA